MDNDQTNETPEGSDSDKEESFAELFESYAAGMNEDIQVGDKISGRIISISDKTVFVDTGTKADGIADLEELRDEGGRIPFEVGDELTLYVVAADESEIRLSKAIAGIGGFNMLKDAHANAIPVEGRVRQSIKGGFQVEVLKRRAFCPISQIDTVYVEDPDHYVGNTYLFLVKKLTEGGRNIVLSRRDLLEAEQEKARQAFMQTLDVGQIHTGRVTRLMPFGAFVELAPGVEGMVHISEISWSRLAAPEEAVKIGDTVQVKVLRIEPGQKQKKIALSIKQIEGDPWETIDQQIKADRKISGKVTRCTNFGAFVEIQPGVEGLVHISELSYTRRILKPEDVVQPGQTVSVMVKEIDSARRRISLSLRDAQGDPWLDVQEKYLPGQAVEGTLESREKFGLFVALEPGVVGLVPVSEINRSQMAAKVDKLRPGDPLPVAVTSVHPGERKISLKLRDSADENNWRRYADHKGNRGLGALGEKLARALKDHKDNG